MHRRRFRLFVGLVMTWDFFFLARRLKPDPSWSWEMARLYVLSVGLGALMVKTTPGMNRPAQAVYALLVLLVVGLNLMLTLNTRIGPAALVLGATMISTGPGWHATTRPR